MAFTFTTSGACITAAGLNVSTANDNTFIMNDWSNQAESTLCDIALFDVIGKFSSLTASGKEILGAYELAYVGSQIINFSHSAAGVEESNARLNFYENLMVRIKAIFEDGNVRDYLKTTETS